MDEKWIVFRNLILRVRLRGEKNFLKHQESMLFFLLTKVPFHQQYSLAIHNSWWLERSIQSSQI